MMTSHTWLIANWKMHGDASRVAAYAFAVNAALAQAPAHVRGVFCPPMPYLSTARGGLPANARLLLGAQNCHAQASGAHTGEVSAPMLADVGCRYVIIGHSERRATGETDADVQAKTQAAQAAGLLPVVCVGELAEDYAQQRTEAVLAHQLEGIKPFAAQPLLIAYEPVWAIGSGKTPSLEEIAGVHRFIKTALGSTVSVLYGGSVNPGNIAQITGLPEVSGALIGGASLEINSMAAMIAACGN